MEARELGIFKRDGIYFHLAAPFAREELFYLLWGATYWLDAPYRENRSYMDAFMIQYVVEGNLHFELRGEHFIAGAGEAVLLNCRETNRYWADAPATVKWFHFHGRDAEKWFDRIYAHSGSGHFAAARAGRAASYIDAVLAGLKNKTLDDFQYSHNIYSILCELAASPPPRALPREEAARAAAAFMRERYAQPLSIADAAARANLSVYYFTRLFKEVMRASPHAYLLELRLDNAKKMLLYSSFSIEMIAAKSGFQSASHFIRAFKKSVGMTPNGFRKYFFSKEKE